MQRVETGSFVCGMSLRQAALVVALGYVLNPVVFAEAYAMPRLFVSDAAQTVVNLAAHPHLFAAAILSYLVSVVGDVVIAWAFYVLLAPVNRALALLGSLLQVTYAGVWLGAIANLGVLYRLVLVPDYASHVSAGALPLLGVELLAAYHSGWGLGLVLFGLHLAVTGWLFARSNYLPRWLGRLLMVDGLAWVVNSLSVYLYPNAQLGFLNAVFVVELILMVWLLGWGRRIREPSFGVRFETDSLRDAS